MHTAHLILVQAESHEDAAAKVWGYLNSDGEHFASDWSDWAIVGDEGFGKSRWTLHDFLETPLTLTNDYVVSYKSEREQFNALLSFFENLRQSKFDELKRSIEEISVDSLELPRTHVWSEAIQNVWKLARLADLASGIYTPDSAYYDLENQQVTLGGDAYCFDASINAGETDWFGVVVDFHL